MISSNEIRFSGSAWSIFKRISLHSFDILSQQLLSNEITAFLFASIIYL